MDDMSNATASTLGDAIRKARKRAGMTQGDVADRVGVRQATVSSWELGTTDLPAHKLIAVMQVLGATASEILGPVLGEAPHEDAVTLARRLAGMLAEGDQPQR